MSLTISVSCRCCHCRMPMSIPQDYICQSRSNPSLVLRVKEQIGANLLEVSPTLMTAVPRSMKSCMIVSCTASAPKVAFAKLFTETVRLGRKRLEGRHLLPHEFILDRILDRLVRQKIHARLGAASIFYFWWRRAQPGNWRFLWRLAKLQGYGQTEASPVISANRPSHIKIETVGPPIAAWRLASRKMEKFWFAVIF